VSKCERVANHQRAMITKEDAVEIAARFLRTGGYAINSQEPTCCFIKKSDVLSRFQSSQALEMRELHPDSWDSMVERLARDRWIFSFTVGEEDERVWQIVYLEVDAQSGEPSTTELNPPPSPPPLRP
jgi:hypothetical protein